MLAALQAETVVVAAVAVAAAAVVEDPFELEVTLKTGLTLQRSGELCMGTGGWATYEAGSRGRDGERTAALCEGKAALEDAGTGLGEVTGR